MICDFCETATENVYKHVYLCPRCGLVQSEPRSDRTISISCEADQGNLRNGKAFRFPQSIPLLEWMDWSEIKTSIDIGANTGAFTNWMIQNHSNVLRTAVEPEQRLADPYRHMVIFHGNRFEDNEFEDESFDFAFSSHTLEHSLSAKAQLAETYRILRPSGLALLEIPSIRTLEDRRVVEEFFIYKHNYHFCPSVLIPYLLDLGFGVERDLSTQFDIRLLLIKRLPPIPFRAFGWPVPITRHTIDRYAKDLEMNRAVLPIVAKRIESLSAKTAIWGAGRIFDALVRYGEFDTSRIAFLVDWLLSGVVDRIHGMPVLSPGALQLGQPDTIVVLGRTSSDAMVKEAQEFAPSVVTFNDLLDEALV